MLTIYRTTEKGLTVVNEVVSGCWINLIDPTTDEIERVANLGVPQDFFNYPLSLDELSRAEKEDDGIQLILLSIHYF